MLILAIIATTTTAQEITYREYMQRVLTDNIALTARSLDIEIADAQAKSSRTYNDPTLAVTYTNNEDWDKKLGQGIEVELGKTFTFGVRKSRMAMADSERKMTVALLEEYMRNFYADASLAYLEHLRAQMLFDEATDILNTLKEIADGDSLPDWARQSVVNCAAAGILPVSGNAVRGADALTREEAALMLYGMMTHGED